MATLPARTSLLLSLVFALVAPAARTDGPPVDARRFPKLVRLLLLPEEQALLKELKDNADRLEFQKIFWARRDPTPATAVNEFEDAVRASWARADELFAMPNERGAETGCGQVLALLGPPELVEGLDAQARFDSLQAARQGSRRPETWTYRDRPGRAFSFTRAELRVSFDPECRFDEGGILLQDLRRAAESRVVQGEIAYRRGPDQHLVPLAAAGAGASADARSLLATPREDFPLAAESKLLMRAPKGEAYLAGLVRAAAGVAGNPVSLSVTAQAVDANGQTAANVTREITARPEPDGGLVASWGLSLKPGHYKLTLGALLREGGKGSVSAIEVEVPDFWGAALAVSPLVLYPDEPASAVGTDARDAYAALQLGPLRIRSRFGNVFAPADSLTVVAALYGATLDTATGQASLRARYSVLKGGRPVARGGEDVFRAKDAVAAVGPIPLSNYEPGAYVVRLDVTDDVAKQTLRQEAAFEVRAAEAKP